jgi:hypothetical protein
MPMSSIRVERSDNIILPLPCQHTASFNMDTSIPVIRKPLYYYIALGLAGKDMGICSNNMPKSKTVAR